MDIYIDIDIYTYIDIYNALKGFVFIEMNDWLLYFMFYYIIVILFLLENFQCYQLIGLFIFFYKISPLS